MIHTCVHILYMLLTTKAESSDSLIATEELDLMGIYTIGIYTIGIYSLQEA